MLNLRSCCRIESRFQLALKEIYDHGIWSLVSQAVRVTVNSFSSVLSLQRGRSARWMGGGGCCRWRWFGRSTEQSKKQKHEKTKKKNATASFWPWDGKWFDTLRATFCPMYVLPTGHPLGFDVFFCSYQDFPECCLKREFVIVPALLLVVDLIVEAWHSHCVWACFLPWPLKTFFQKTDCLCLICGYPQRRSWLEMRALL